MKYAIALMVLCLTVCRGYAGDTNQASGAEAFVRQMIQSLISDDNTITFEVAETVFAIDNGEIVLKEDLLKAWPRFGREAFKKKVSVGQFFKDVKVEITSPLDNKGLMSNERVLRAYKYQEGDLYCDASHVKEGVESFIAYDKAFIYIIRKVQGRWTLIGIGG